MRTFLCAGALLIGALPALALPAVPNKMTQLPNLTRELCGRVSFLERIALPPGYMARVAIYQSIGGESVPLVVGTFPCDAGGAAFSLLIPANAGPLLARAWILRLDGSLWHRSPAPIPVPRGANDLQLLTRGVGPLPVAPPTIGLPVQEPTVTGEISKLDRRALAPDARVEVELRDVSRADAPSKLIGRQIIELKGRQLPVSYSIPFPRVGLDPRGRFSVSARVLEGTGLSYVTTENLPFDPAKGAQTVNVLVRNAMR